MTVPGRPSPRVRPDLRVPRNLERYGSTISAGAAIAPAEEPLPARGATACGLTFGGGGAVSAILLRGPP